MTAEELGRLQQLVGAVDIQQRLEAFEALPALLQEIERLRTTEGLIEHNDFREIAEANAARLVAARVRESRLREAAQRALDYINPTHECSCVGMCVSKQLRAALTAEGK